MRTSLFCTLAVTLAVGLLVAGCDDNVFDGLNSEGTSDDPQVLLADARAALAKGDTTQAIDYLERAHDVAPENAEVRVELVGTKFEKNNVDLIAIREIAEYIADGSKALRTAKNADADYYCSFDEEPGETFDFAEAPAYQRLVGLSDLFDEAITLLGDLDASEVDLSEELTARMLLMRAFTRAFQTIVAVDQEVKEIEVDLFRLSNGDIGVCADASEFNSVSDAQQIVDEIEQIIDCTLLPGYEQAIDDLRTRNELLRGNLDSLILDTMGEALDAMRNSINGDCTAD